MIWCLDAGQLREENEKNNSKLSSLKGISWVYDTRSIENSFTDLNALDASHGDGEVIIIWEPPSLDARIANQCGLLSLANSPSISQHKFLDRSAAQSSNLVKKIIIKSKAKSQIRDMLDQNNISERTLFPGMPGLSQWLKRYYGSAW